MSMQPSQPEVAALRPGSAGTAGELVSVIIPAYNMARFLPQAVESVLAQSYGNLEIQIIDDGSKDDTPEVVRQWQSNPRVRVHRQANGGLSHARNQGVALTRGSFVALLDADDIWLPQKLALQMPLFRGRPELGVVYSDYVRMDEEGKPLPNGPTRMHRGSISGPLLIENFVPASTAVVRRGCFERCGGFDVALRTGEDYEMWLRLSAHFQFDFIAEPTMRYRTGGWQMSTDYRGRYETAIRVMQGFLDKNPDAVDGRVVRSAWAHTYTGRGNVTLWRGHDRINALRDYLKALSFRPGYWPAWRAILRSFITSSAPSAG
jgi:glycosyltransferase involved in cell wall biosynthesis